MKPRKPLLHIVARAKNDKVVDLWYYSLKQAAYFNPGLHHFRAVGFRK